MVVPFGLLAGMTMGLLVLLIWARAHHPIALGIVMGLFVLLGWLLTLNYRTLRADDIAFTARYYRHRPITVAGTIVSDVEKRRFFSRMKTVFILNVKQVKAPWGWQSRRGIILVNIFRDEAVRYGDYVRLEGKLHKPFEFDRTSQFSYRDYLARKGIGLILSVKKNTPLTVLARDCGYSWMRFAYHLKRRWEKLLFEYFSFGEAGILQAMVLGDQYNIPQQVQQLCVLSGVAHVFAISGFNVGIVSGLLMIFLRILPIPRKMQYALTIALIVFYAILTGGRPPVVRATIMTTVFLLSFMIERETDSINTLALAGLIILAVNPLTLFDVGFQLSFLCVFFILYLFPGFWAWLVTRTWIMRVPVVWPVIQSAAVSLAAWLGAAGMIVFYFHIVTPVAILANLVVIPLISLVVVLEFGFLLAGTFFPWAVAAFVICIKLLLFLTMLFVDLCTRLPGAYFTVKALAPAQVLLIYIILFLSPYLISGILSLGRWGRGHAGPLRRAIDKKG